MIEDEYIKKINIVIKEGNEEKAEYLYNEIVSVYKYLIKDIEGGTSCLNAKMNMVWNLNELENKLPENCDYIEDLKLLSKKLTKYRDDLIMSNKKNNLTANKQKIVINNSKITNSNIGSTIHDSKHKEKAIFKIIGLFAGIATIIGLIITILRITGKI